LEGGDQHVSSLGRCGAEVNSGLRRVAH
jgi:hypothetical protein